MAGSYTPSASAISVSNSAQISRVDASRGSCAPAATSPSRARGRRCRARPRRQGAESPARPSTLAPERPRSSSMTTICSRGQPNCAARSASAYCSRVEHRRSPDDPDGAGQSCRRTSRCGAGQGPHPSSNASVATGELRIRCQAICPSSVAMRPRRSTGQQRPDHRQIAHRGIQANAPGRTALRS